MKKTSCDEKYLFLFKKKLMMKKKHLLMKKKILRKKTSSPQEENNSDEEDELDLLMSTDIVTANMSMKDVSFCPTQTGWIFSREKMEMVGR